MDNEIFQKEITKRLDAIIRLLAASSMKEASLTEKIFFLNKSGFTPKEISEIINTSSNYVSVILSTMRKKEKIKLDGQDQPENRAIVTPLNGETRNE